MNPCEYQMVSQYSATELAGALLIGRQARITTDAYLRAKYTWHCAEEARHADMWMELLVNNGLEPLSVHDSEGDQYFSYAKECQDDIDFLAFVHVYEWRVPFHLALHAQLPGITEPTRELMLQLVQEEGAHLSWVAEYLEKQQASGNERVAQAVQHFGEIEERTYKQDIERMQQAGGDFGVLGDLLLERLPTYEAPWQFLIPDATAAGQ